MTATGRIEGAEALLNADGEVALIVPPLAHRPLAWRDAGPGVVELVAGARAVGAFGCAPAVLEAMAGKGRLLLVEAIDGLVSREGWLARSSVTSN